MKLTSYEPYWLRKNGLITAYPSLTEDIETDVLIIGAGITGSLMAHQVVKDGYRTVVIDRRDIATGSTSATTSMLQYEIDIPLHKLIEKVGEQTAVASYQACFDSISQLKTLVDEVQSDCGFAFQDSLLYASKPSHSRMLQKELYSRAKYGFPVRWLTESEILETYGIQKTFGGILTDRGGRVDAYILANDLVSYNVAKGLRVYDRTELSEVKENDEFLLAITSQGKRIKAKRLIYSTGYEVTELLSKKVVKLLSSFALVSEQNLPGIEKYKNTLFWNTDDPYMYFRSTDDGRLLVGGQDLPFKNEELRDKLIDKQTAKLEGYIKKHLVDFELTTDYTWAGTFGETKDGLPIIGEHKDYPNAYFVLGFGGNGITFSVAGMEMVSNWFRGKTHHLTDYFRFDR